MIIKRLAKLCTAVLSLSILTTSMVWADTNTISPNQTVTNSIGSVRAPEEGTEDYTVTFDANGGEFTQTMPKLVNIGTFAKFYNITYTGTTKASVTLPAGEDLTGYPIYPERDGYHCIGYALTADATEAEDQLTPTDDDVHVYAVWAESNAYTPVVTYNSNYGHWSDLSRDCNNVLVSKTAEGYPVTEPTRTGATFGGWSSSPTSYVAVDFDGIIHDTLVFAWWTDITETHTVTFHPNGGKIMGSTADKVYTINPTDTGTLNAPTATRDEYEFVGWSKTADGTNLGTSITIDKSTIADNLEYYALWNLASGEAEIPDDDDPTEEDTTIVKKWQIGTPTSTSVTATLYTDGRLVFNGTGDFDVTAATDMWRSSDYKDDIKKVIFAGDLQPTNISGILKDCVNITSLDVGGLDLTQCEDMSYAFQNCKYLTAVRLSIFNMNHIKNIAYMFDGCTRLTTLILPKMNAASLLTATNAFSNCIALTSLDLSNINTKNVSNMYRMTYGDESLMDIKVGSNFVVPVNAISSYNEFGNVFQTNLGEALSTTVTGEMSKTFSQYANTLFTSDNRTLLYDQTAYMKSVTFDYNYPDGTANTTIKYVASGELVAQPSDPEYDGFTFNYWSYNGAEFSFTTPITENITLTAKWTEDDQITGKTFTYLFYNGDAIFTTLKPLGYSTVTAPTGPDKTATEEFSHWSLTKGGTAYDFSQKVTDNKTFYAVYKRRSDLARVVIDYNGGEYKDKSSVSMDVLIGTKIKRPSYKPKQDDYKFKDWYADPNESEKFKFNKAITGDTTIYAGWVDKDDDDDDDDDNNSSSSGSDSGSSSGTVDTSQQAPTEETSVWDQLLQDMQAAGVDNGQISTLTADGVPQTGIKYNIIPPIALLLLFATLVIIFIKKRHTNKG